MILRDTTANIFGTCKFALSCEIEKVAECFDFSAVDKFTKRKRAKIWQNQRRLRQNDVRNRLLRSGVSGYILLQCIGNIRDLHKGI